MLPRECCSFFCVTPEWICMHAMCLSLSCLCPVITHSTRRRQRWMDRWMCNTLEPSSSPPVATVCATMQTASSKKNHAHSAPLPRPKLVLLNNPAQLGASLFFFVPTLAGMCPFCMGFANLCAERLSRMSKGAKVSQFRKMPMKDN